VAWDSLTTTLATASQEGSERVSGASAWPPDGAASHRWWHTSTPFPYEGSAHVHTVQSCYARKSTNSPCRGRDIHAMLPGFPTHPARGIEPNPWTFVATTNDNHISGPQTCAAACRTRCTSLLTHGSSLKCCTQPVNPPDCQIDSIILSSRLQCRLRLRLRMVCIAAP
jgi:hypothetical protein